MNHPRYLLQARALEGPLYAPTRNDTRNEHGDDWPRLVTRARALTDEGFTVWLYTDASPGPGRMRCIAVHTPETTGQTARVLPAGPLGPTTTFDPTTTGSRLDRAHPCPGPDRDQGCASRSRTRRPA